MKKINFRKTLFAAVLLFQLNAIAAFGQTVVKGSVKDNTGKPISGVVVTDGVLGWVHSVMMFPPSCLSASGAGPLPEPQRSGPIFARQVR